MNCFVCPTSMWGGGEEGRETSSIRYFKTIICFQLHFWGPMQNVNGATWSDETNEQMKEMGGSFDIPLSARFSSSINFIITSLVLFLSANERGMGGSFNCSPTCPIKAKFITYQAILPTLHPTKLCNYHSCLVWNHGPMGPQCGLHMIWWVQVAGNERDGLQF